LGSIAALRMEPFFYSKDSADLLYGPLSRARRVATSLEEFEPVFSDDGNPRLVPAPEMFDVESPRRTRHSRFTPPEHFLTPESTLHQWYREKVRLGRIQPAGLWGAIRHGHLLRLTGDRALPRKLTRLEYLVRVNQGRLEIFSTGYVPLFRCQAISRS
jgi:hypothetical protein